MKACVKNILLTSYLQGLFFTLKQSEIMTATGWTKSPKNLFFSWARLKISWSLNWVLMDSWKITPASGVINFLDFLLDLKAVGEGLPIQAFISWRWQVKLLQPKEQRFSSRQELFWMFEHWTLTSAGTVKVKENFQIAMYSWYDSFCQDVN